MQRVYACTSCTRRKTKCDKLQPICSTCKRLKTECLYQEPVKKRKREPEASSRGLGRLYTDSGNQRYVESTLWRSLQHPEDIIDAEEQSPFASALLGVPQARQELQHPSLETAALLWNIYKDRIDPLVKILHLPTTDIITPFDPPKECLAFAVYFFAASSLTDAESVEMLGQAKQHLVYHAALNQALLNADFLRTTNIQVMQALVLLLTATRGRTDPQLFWIMMGVAIRIATRMGLHRDGAITGLPPFDTEIGRRLFWQLPSLEGFAGQFAGIGSSSLDSMSWDTQRPLNINDADIWPDMEAVPVERKGATVMLFLLVRVEFSSFYKEFVGHLRALEQDPKVLDKAMKRIDEIEDKLESKFLRYCDPMEPVHLCASLMARVAVQASRVRVQLQSVKTGNTPEGLLNTALQVFDRFVVSQSHPDLRKYRVHTSSFVLWDILVFVVNHMYVATPIQREESWKRLASLYECQENLLKAKLPIAVAINRNILRAWDTTATGPELEMITKLRSLLQVDVPKAPVMPDIDLDAIEYDWAFWDSLIRDPDSLTVGTL